MTFALENPIQPDARQGLSAPKGLMDLLEHASRLQEAGEIGQALKLYENWLTTELANPQRHFAWFNFGTLLFEIKNWPAAQLAYENCLVSCPQFIQASVNLGLVYERNGQTSKAIQIWAEGAAQRFWYPQVDASLVVTALNHIGRLQESLKNYAPAEQALEESLRIDPNQPGVLQHWIHIRQKACQWPTRIALPGVSPHALFASTSPLSQLAFSDIPSEQLLAARSFVQRSYDWVASPRPAPHDNHSRIRVGYVSSDLCTHAVGVLLHDFLAAHDRSVFEIYGYDCSPEDGTELRQKLKRQFDHFQVIAEMDDASVAQRIAHDEIDVLIDLNGLSSGARPGIFAKRPAALQGTYLGFIGTTSMPWIDFAIADSVVVDKVNEGFHTEHVLKLDTCFLPFNDTKTPVENFSRGRYGLPQAAFVMAAFGNSYKINQALFDDWLSMLENMPRAVLWLIDDNSLATQNLTRYAKSKGIAENRLVFTPRVPHAEFKSMIRCADVFLDTFPYNCGSTTNDVLAAGVTFVTRKGQSMVSRMGASVLSHFGRDEFIAHDANEYKKKVQQIYDNDPLLQWRPVTSSELKNSTATLVRSLEKLIMRELQKVRMQSHSDSV